MHPVSRAPRVLFPLALFLVSALFFGGALGKWNDDWFFNQADPATGAVASYLKTAPTPFHTPTGRPMAWRPLHHAFTPFVITTLWDHDRALHLIGALIHGANALLLRRLLLSFGLRPTPAALGSLLLLVYPIHFEVIFWPSAFSTGIATACMLLTIHQYGAYVRGSRARLLLTLSLTGILIPLFNEQPAGALAALPILALACRPASTIRDPARLARRALGPLFILGVAYILYVHLVQATAPPGAIATIRAIVPSHRLLPRIPEFFRELWLNFDWPHYLRGMLSAGRETLAASALGRAAWFTLLGLALAWAASSALRPGGAGLPPVHPDSPGSQPGARSTPPPLSHARLAVFAIAMLVTAFIPIYIMDHFPVRPRMHYAPATAAATLIAILLDAVPARVARPAIVRVVAALPATAALLLGAVMLVGVQSGYRARAQASETEAAALLRLLPDPDPDTLFLPLQADTWPTQTDAWRFNTYFGAPWHPGWSYPAFLRRAYSRDDIHAAYRGDERQILSADELTVRISGELDSPYPRSPDGGHVIPWDSVVPLLIAPAGEVRIATELVIPTPSGPLLIRPLQPQRLLTQGRIPAREFTTLPSARAPGR